MCPTLLWAARNAPAMSTADHPLVNRLKAARELAGLSQIELGELLGEDYGRATISKYERGTQKLNGLALQKWARACKVSLDFFFVDFTEVRTPEPPLTGDVFEQLEALGKRINSALAAER